MKIYVLVGAQEQGPYTKSEIFALMKHGILGPDALGRWENEIEWQLIDRVLASNGLGFFTADQIAKQQEEISVSPIIVPDFIPPRRETDFSPAAKSKKVIFLAAIAIALSTCSVLLLIHAGHEDKPTYLEITEIPSSPVPVASSIAQDSPMPLLSTASVAKVASKITSKASEDSVNNGPASIKNSPSEIRATTQLQSSQELSQPSPEPPATPLPVRSSFSSSAHSKNASPILSAYGLP